MPETGISPARLTDLRAAGVAAARADGRFVNPHVIHRCMDVLTRRGEGWAAAVLGRDLAARSVGAPQFPALRSGEAHTLIDADVEEDRITISRLDY